MRGKRFQHRWILKLVLLALIIFVGIQVQVLVSLGSSPSSSWQRQEEALPKPLPWGKMQAGIFFGQNGTTPNTYNLQKKQHPLLLSVPFYVYEELVWWLEGGSVTLDGVPLKDAMEDVKYHDQFATAKKHASDYWLAKAALDHPLRTHDPTKAKIFVIPTLMNLHACYYAAECGFELCATTKNNNESDGTTKKLCNEAFMNETERVLENSPYFQPNNNRRPHVIVMSHWLYQHRQFETQRVYFPKQLQGVMLPQCHMLMFERDKINHKDRYAFSDVYVGNPCPIKEKQYDVVFVGRLNHAKQSPKNNATNTVVGKKKNRKKLFQDRQDLCRILSEQRNDTTTNMVTFPVCGPGRQCPALAESKLGFHVRGDTMSANRLMDTILSGTVPIFTKNQQYMVLPKFLYWRRMSYQLEITIPQDDDHSKVLNTIHSFLRDEETYRQKHHWVLQHQHFIDWTTLHPFDLYLHMLQRRLYPDTILAYSKDYEKILQDYPLLKLDTRE